MDSYADLVTGVVRSVALERTPDLPAISPEQELVDDLGLTSLDLAVVVAKLEVKLGWDPFANLVSITTIRTVGDLCAAYDRSAPQAADENAA